MAILFNSSTSNSALFLGWIDYRFSDAFVLSAGYFKVPGSREWSDSFRYTLGADRTMATTFFRPSMSPGIWASGEPVENFHYISMIANSFNGLNLADNRIGSVGASATSLWWEPLGKFGPGPSDIEWHERPTLRIGSSLTLSREALASPTTVRRTRRTRSSDSRTAPRWRWPAPWPPGRRSIRPASSSGRSTRRSSTGASAFRASITSAGSTISATPAARRQYAACSTTGPTPRRRISSSPAVGERTRRCSFVTGRFGGGDEWSGGLNWYVLGTRDWRMTFDVTRINHSPADNATDRLPRRRERHPVPATDDYRLLEWESRSGFRGVHASAGLFGGGAQRVGAC